MNLDTTFRGVFDRTCRRLLQMVMATDLSPKGSVDSNEVKTGAMSGNMKGAPSQGTRNERQLKRALRSKSASTSLNCVAKKDMKDRITLASENGPPARQSEPSVTVETPNHHKTESCQSQVTHLRQLLLLHLELIQQQQEQLQSKDKELNQLKIDKEQLESRMHRMERRMAVKKRHQDLSNNDMDTLDEKVKPVAPKSRRLSAEQMIRTKRVPATFSVVMSSHMSEDVSYGTHMRTELLYLHRPDQDSSKSCNSPPRKSTATETTDNKHVMVPQWQLNELTPLSTKSGRLSTRGSPIVSGSEPQENIDDEAYIKRHLKQELEEKRRKRWDVQRHRELLLHKSLEERTRMREEARLKGRKSISKDSDTSEQQQSVLPSSGEILALEVSDTVPVSVFGCPIPLFQSREFDIPWFSLERRELQERATKDRPKSSRGRGRGGCRFRGRGRRKIA